MTKTPLEIVQVERGGRGINNMFMGNEGKVRVHPEREMKRSGTTGKGGGRLWRNTGIFGESAALG